MWAAEASSAAVLRGDRDREHVGDRARDLDARRTATYDHEVQSAALHQGRVAIDLLEEPEDARAQPGRVVERVQRERVLGRAGRAEEVRLRPGGQNQRVGGELLAVARRTVLAAVSTVAMSASLTSTFSLPANTPRSECAMSLGASCEVATW